jgi:hypothetical protein
MWVSVTLEASLACLQSRNCVCVRKFISVYFPLTILFNGGRASSARGTLCTNALIGRVLVFSVELDV